jgi:hypothetical protein
VSSSADAASECSLPHPSFSLSPRSRADLSFLQEHLIKTLSTDPFSLVDDDELLYSPYDRASEQQLFPSNGGSFLLLLLE